MIRMLSVALLMLLACAVPCRAQTKYQYLGPNECLNCHDHDAEREWYEKKEIPEVRRLFPDRDAKAGHINSLNQLETPKSDEFAKAIGQTDKYDVNGKCVSCHATVFRGDANAGVSCEMCHGPGSGYLKPHQTKDTYDLSVSNYGMVRLIGNIQGWTQQCTNCHVMDDERLIKAGHPDGADFDLSKKYLPVSLHFKKKYTEQEVAAIARPQMAAILDYRRGTKASGGDAPPPAAAPSPAAPASTPTPAAATERAATAVPPPTAAASATKAPPPAAAAAPPAPRDVNTARPGDPTSILPKFPIPAAVTNTPGATPPPAAATPAPAASTVAVQEEPIQTSTVAWLIGLVVGLAVGAIWYFSRRR